MEDKRISITKLVLGIAVIAVIIFLVVPAVTKYVNTASARKYENMLETLKIGSKDYINRENIKIAANEQVVVTLSSMYTGGLIENVIDPKTGKECEGYVLISKTDVEYVFKPYLKCGENYLSENYSQEQDFTVPTITLLGKNPVSIYAGEEYRDAGATATDNKDGRITDRIIVTGEVNKDVVGSYEITYAVSDSSNNTKSIKRVVNVIKKEVAIEQPSNNSGSGNNQNPGTTPSTGKPSTDKPSTDKPSTDQIKPSITIGSGTYQNNTWTNSKVTLTATATPAANNYKYQWYKNDIAINGATTSTYVVESNTVGNYYIRAKNSLASITSNTITVKSDSIAPTKPTISGGGDAYALSRTIQTTASTETGSGIDRYEYYLSSASTLPSINSVGVSNGKSLTKKFDSNFSGYYVYFRAVDNVGNKSDWSNAQRLFIDVNNPTISANSASYTISQGASSELPGSYFTVNRNGGATISGATCVDTSNANVAVTNTSSLAVGTHTIKCTSTKTTGTSAYATTNMIVKVGYTCATGALTYDVSKGGYVCVASNYTWTPQYTYDCPDGTHWGGSTSFSYCWFPPVSGACTCSGTVTIGTNYTCWDDSAVQQASSCGGSVMVNCDFSNSSCGSNHSYCTTVTCSGEYSNITCPYGGTYDSSMKMCKVAGTNYVQGESTYSCPSGWSIYSGSGSNLKCYKAASQS